ncbi:hypothetical protein CMO86_06290 [Candidatus Woesearchaeota archaeon]|nr:hypothetical protein [Candidatus Woesearchaeota archaeon]
MGHIYDMFSVPLVKYHIANWKENKKRILESLPKLNQEHLDRDVGLYTDFFEVIKNNNLPTYSNVVIDIIKPYLADFTQQRCVEFTNMWFQTAFKGNSHGLHNHGHSGWSSVIYVEFNPQFHTSTKFISPFNNPWDGNLVDFMPEVQEGDMIIFPSTLTHESLPNQSEVRRTIVSYNLRGHVDCVKKKLWDGDSF